MSIRRVHKRVGGRWVREHYSIGGGKFRARQTSNGADEGCCWCDAPIYSPACAGHAGAFGLRMDGTAPPDDFRIDTLAPPSLAGCSPYTKSPYQAIFGGNIKVTCTFVDTFRTATRCTSHVRWYINDVASGSMDFNEFTPVPSSTSIHVSQGDFWGLVWDRCDFTPAETAPFGGGCSRCLTETEKALRSKVYTVTPLALVLGDCPTAQWATNTWNALPTDPGQVVRETVCNWYTLGSSSSYYKFLGGRLKVQDRIQFSSCLWILTRTAIKNDGSGTTVNLWTGSKSVETVSGTYTRTSGCDTTATYTVGGGGGGGVPGAPPDSEWLDFVL